MQSETLVEEFSRLVREYKQDDGPGGIEAWNLIADFAIDNAEAIEAALSAAEPQPAPSVAVKAIEAVWKYSLVIESSVRRGDGPDQYAGVTEALRLVKEARSALSAQVQGVSKETIPQNKETLDQVAAIMLQHGTPAQRAEAIAYASPVAPAKQEG